MAEFRELKDRANNFRKQKQFEQATSIYEQIFRECPNEVSGWEQIGYASCLRYLGFSDKALNTLREWYPKIKNADPVDERLFSWCRNEYGRCIYDTEIKLLNQDSPVDEMRLLKAANAITQLTVQEEFSPYELTVFRIVDYFADKQNTPYEQINQWLEKLDPVKLSRQPRPSEADDSRNETYPSPLEKWLSIRAKSLLETHQYAESIKICDFALSSFSKFHYGFDVWFRWYRAKCFLALNQPEDALSDLREVQKVKREFFVDQEIAHAFFLLNQLDNSLEVAAKAALAGGGLEYKWELFLMMGELLEKKGENSFAQKHIQLAWKIRQEQSWNKLPNRLQEIIHRQSVNLTEIPDANVLKRELSTYWKSLKKLPQTEWNGVIVRLHDNGKSGVIQNSDGRQHFFGVKSFLGSKNVLRVDILVGFNLIDAVHPKTGKQELHAVDIVEINRTQ